MDLVGKKIAADILVYLEENFNEELLAEDV